MFLMRCGEVVLLLCFFFIKFIYSLITFFFCLLMGSCGVGLLSGYCRMCVVAFKWYYVEDSRGRALFFVVV